MQTTPPPATSRSLIDVSVGEQIAVGNVLFDVVRHHCAERGVCEGMVMQCECRTPRTMQLRRADGVRVELDRVYAVFVEVLPWQ